ncbi:MAG TPA: hypothetical protein VEK77_14535 [Gemmatimonadales bacterium]|nr:hypothetical protein [Gemmatimonadales bacterium]
MAKHAARVWKVLSVYQRYRKVLDQCQPYLATKARTPAALRTAP